MRTITERLVRVMAVILGVVCSLIEGDGVALSVSHAGDTAPAIRLVPLISGGLQQPLYATHAGDGSGRLFILEQKGRVLIVDQGVLQATPFLDITDRVLSGGERGLLGLAFHPDYKRNGRFFVNYTRKPDGATVVAEYRRAEAQAQALPSERVLMLVAQPAPNHNGGMIDFGPDGFLYIALGDGGPGGDPQNRGQNPYDLLGKILRINVDRGDPYGIPVDNPFVTGGGRPEVFALGFRNPWRFSFDRETGALWVADVGQGKWEEIDLVHRGKNYGWRIMEGAHCFKTSRWLLLKFWCDTTGLTMPIAEYGHQEGRCVVTGGYVYRGTKGPALRGWYLFGDYCSGEIFGLRPMTGGSPISQEHLVLIKSRLRISSFGEDEEGEVYVVGYEGTVHRISAELPPPSR